MPPETNRSSALGSSAFYVLLAAIVLSPLVFWSSQYFALEAVKTLVIGVLTLAAVILLALEAVKEKSLKLPPRNVTWLGFFMAVSIVASAWASGTFSKSFFGQGFELGAGTFMLVLMVASLVSYVIVAKRAERAVVLYTGLVASFLILWLFQVLRLIFGPDFATLGILGSLTSTVLGSWFSFGIYAAVISVISLLAIMLLPLTTKMKAAYSVLAVLSGVTLFVINNRQIWEVVAIVFLGLTIYLAASKVSEGSGLRSLASRLSWVPFVAFLIAAIFAWQGTKLATPVITGLKVAYTELALPWRLTLDVASGELKSNPILGSGPNRFVQSFLTNKPIPINSTDLWGIEFNSGFGYIPTIFVTQGLFGGLLWTLFLVFFGILGHKSLSGLFGGNGLTVMEPERPYARFLILSSYAAASVIWLMALVYVPVHSMMFLAFVLTGIWLGASVFYGRLSSITLSSMQESRTGKVLISAQIVVMVVALLWGFTFVKDAAALAYFSKGANLLTSAIPDAVAADDNFQTAVRLNNTDIYWRARAEAGIILANQILSRATATSTSEQNAAIAAEAGQLVNKSLSFASTSIGLDAKNYNNYVSMARVSELGTAMKMNGAYETAVKSYIDAINLNPGNPALYLSLARLQASENQLDAAIQTIGQALRVKNNYLDAVFVLSQIQAAKGNLGDAIVAAQFATELNPSNALLFFQLGLLQYTNGSYASAEASLLKAVAIEKNYANAQYFLGLSYARNGKIKEAIEQFENLALTNPNSQEVQVILSTLRAGKSLFATGSQAVSAARPEKKATPPIRE